MDFSILAPTLERYGAPLIAELLDTAAGAVGGPLAGMAVKGVTDFVLSKLGAAFDVPSNDPEAISQAVETAAQADPAGTATKLQAVQDDHADLIRQAMAQAQIDEANVENARSTEIQRTVHGSWYERAAPLILGLVIVVGFFGTVIGVMIGRLNTADPMVAYSLTTEGAAFMILVGYYFGSSIGSKAKTDMIAAGLPPSKPAKRESR